MKKEILFQMDTAWRLFQYHCNGLGEEEAAWCKTYSGLQVRRADGKWTSFIDSMDEADLRSDERCRWPFKGQSLCSLALWLNVELMKNAAEIGAARFLYAVISE